VGPLACGTHPSGLIRTSNDVNLLVIVERKFNIVRDWAGNPKRPKATEERDQLHGQ
jgi:hypothetical protein